MWSHGHRERKYAEGFNKWHNKFIFLNCFQRFGNLNHNSFWMLFDKIAYVYFIWKIYIYILASGMASPGTGTVPIVSAHFRSL